MTRPKHPLVVYGESRGWTPKETADFFRIRSNRLYQLKGGHQRCSWETAKRFERRSRGEVRAEAIMEWQRLHSRRRAA